MGPHWNGGAEHADQIRWDGGCTWPAGLGSMGLVGRARPLLSPGGTERSRTRTAGRRKKSVWSRNSPGGSRRISGSIPMPRRGTPRWALWRHGHLVHVQGDFHQTVDVASLRKTWHAMIVGAATPAGADPVLPAEAQRVGPRSGGQRRRGDLVACDDAIGRVRLPVWQSSGLPARPDVDVLRSEPDPPV